MTKSEITKLKSENIMEALEPLKNNSIIEPENIIKSIKIIVAQEKYELLVVFPEILKKYPQFIPYFSDVLKKSKEQLNIKTYNDILTKFSSWLRDDKNLEYILISIINLYDSTSSTEKKILFEFFKNLKRNSGIYIARSVLDQIGNSLTRGELLELKDYYLRADMWEKRQIVNMILEGLSYPENRPFIKDLKINCKDYFILELIRKYEEKNKRN